MPTIQDIIDITQKLEDKPVLALQEKCVGVRNRNASCKKCIAACPVGAISVADNMLTIHYDSCVACQACATACPMGALVPLEPTDHELSAQVKLACANTGGLAVIACTRIASHCEADPHTYAEVPCLCRVDESILVNLAAQGIDDILLIDGDCLTCRFRATKKTADEVFRNATALLQRWGSPTQVRRAQAFPAVCQLSEEARHQRRGESRRRFLGAARDDAKKAAKVTLLNRLNLDTEETQPMLRDMFAVKGNRKTLPQFHAQRQLSLMNALDRIGQPNRRDTFLTTRVWGRVVIDTDACSACGMCTVFCPTGALYAADEDEAVLENCDALYHFWAADCTQCRLCEDVCMKRCLQVFTTIAPDQLIDFEPSSFRLTRRPNASVNLR